MKRSVLMALLVLLTASAVCAQGQKWSIVAIAPTDEKTAYFVHFALSDSAQSGVGQTFESDDLIIASNLLGGEGEPKNLIGKVILDDSEEGFGPVLELERQIFLARNPDYQQPPVEEFYDLMIEALSGFSCPDFTAQDPVAVKKAFLQLCKWDCLTGTMVRGFAEDAVRQSSQSMQAEVFRETANPYYHPLQFGVKRGEERVNISFSADPQDGSFTCFIERYDPRLRQWLVKPGSR